MLSLLSPWHSIAQKPPLLYILILSIHAIPAPSNSQLKPKLNSTSWHDLSLPLFGWYVYKLKTHTQFSV